MLQGRLVAPEYDVVLCAGRKAALDAVGHWEVLLFDSGHLQTEVVVIMSPCAIGQSRLGGVEPDAAQMAERYGADTPVLDWRERLSAPGAAAATPTSW